MATSLDSWENMLHIQQSARNGLSYGVKYVKIGGVDPEIFDEIL